MAALIRQVLRKTGQQFSLKCDVNSVVALQVRQKHKVKRPYKHLSMGPTLESMAKSLTYKGYLRKQQSYAPSEDISDKIRKLKASSGIKSGENGTKFSPEEKFKFLGLCSQETQHEVPNSTLHEINTISDVIQFYSTPVNTILPLDALKNSDLPENVHIQLNYLRFHPDTDTKFGGQTAFPKSSTIVTGLKYKKMYKGFEAKRSWP